MAQRRRGTKPLYQVKIAKERIALLFAEAAKRSRSDADLAKRYVRLARRIGMRYNVRVTGYKPLFCRKCGRYFTDDRRRLKKKRLEVTCKDCGFVTSRPYGKR